MLSCDPFVLCVYLQMRNLAVSQKYFAYSICIKCMLCVYPGSLPPPAACRKHDLIRWSGILKCSLKCREHKVMFRLLEGLNLACGHFHWNEHATQNRKAEKIRLQVTACQYDLKVKLKLLCSRCTWQKHISMKCKPVPPHFPEYKVSLHVVVTTTLLIKCQHDYSEHNTSGWWHSICAM